MKAETKSSAGRALVIAEGPLAGGIVDVALLERDALAGAVSPGELHCAQRGSASPPARRAIVVATSSGTGRRSPPPRAAPPRAIPPSRAPRARLPGSGESGRSDLEVRVLASWRRSGSQPVSTAGAARAAGALLKRWISSRKGSSAVRCRRVGRGPSGARGGRRPRGPRPPRAPRRPQPVVRRRSGRACLAEPGRAVEDQ